MKHPMAYPFVSGSQIDLIGNLIEFSELRSTASRPPVHVLTYRGSVWES